MRNIVISCFNFNRKDHVQLSELIDFANLEQFEEINLFVDKTEITDLSIAQLQSIAKTNHLTVYFVNFDLIDDDPLRQRIYIWTELTNKKDRFIY
jgi:hypothetical protein